MSENVTVTVTESGEIIEVSLIDERGVTPGVQAAIDAAKQEIHDDFGDPNAEFVSVFETVLTS